MILTQELKEDIKKRERKAEVFAFYLSVWWRVFYGVASLLLGLGLLWLNGWVIADVFSYLVASELVEDPGDIFIMFLGSWLGNNQTPITLFSAIYFIFWGILDIFLYTSILMKKMWAYTVAMYLISFFSAYMVYRFMQTGSMLLFTLIAFDLLIVWLTYRERQRVRKASTQL